MRIALIAKLFAPISKLSTGGTEAFVYNFARELRKRKHDVMVFTTGDSRIEDIKITSVVTESYWSKFNKPIKTENKMFLYRKYMSDEILGYLKFLFYLKNHEKEFDIVHDHALSFLPSILHNDFSNLPYITTLHIDEKGLSNMYKTMKDLIGPKLPNHYFVSISKNQYNSLKDIKPFDINYNGIDADRFSFCDDPDNYLLWIGRIVPEKGLDKAIEIAIKLKITLKIIGSIANESYFKDKIKNNIDQYQNIDYLGEKSGQELVKLYQKAKMLLFPIDWEEPFGLVLIEAMSCGTPIVAFNRGAVSEIIRDGETGFICPPGDIEAMVAAVKKIYDMPPQDYKKMRESCRRHVEENFTVEKMVDGYEKIYQKVIADWKKKNG